MVSVTTWFDARYSATEHGTALLKDLFGKSPFSYPKSIHAVQDCIYIGGASKDHTLILDFFAGSGTTAHAVINLNRQDEDERGSRKFILVEMGDYFHTVTKPRVLKVIYSKDWRDGKPVSRVGSSCLVKILRLESYEDTLNNLTVTRTSQQSDLLALHDAFREQYTLRYLFERETAQSASLLNLDLFENPFDYRLDVTAPGSSAARHPTPVDLIETFNYLLGLRVARRYARDGFRIIEGADPDGSRTLVIWRNAREHDNEALNSFFTEQNLGAQGFNVVYANGDHTLGMTRREGETWQDRMIEMDFKRLMFEE
jgi:adenine-specific DNA-methyltransferase